jgi:hypothetical protein
MRVVAVMALIAALAGTGPAMAQEATGGQGVPGDVLFESRLRYEGVSQDGLEDAKALTARLRLGWRSPEVSHLRLLIEGEAVEALVDDYNDTIHGPASLAVVADPETFELNRLQLTWTGLPDTEVTVGRQRIILGNARFVGNVGFRQNEQTFDAVRVTTTHLRPITLNYAYIDKVHRVFGDDSPVGEWQSDSHLVNAEMPTSAGRLGLYGYWLDFANAAARSSATVGVRLAGERAMNPQWAATWAFEYARQSDYGSNPASFDLDYYLLSGGLRHGPWRLTLARERFDGDGTRGFETPLATLHAFQGWADVFLSTPAAGLTDDSATLAYAWSAPPVGRSATFSASWRTFADADDTQDFGTEFDVSAAWAIDAHWGLEIKAAQFDGDFTYADRSKLWLSVEYRY